LEKPMSDADLIAQLRERIAELERANADLERHNKQLREAIEALMSPDKPTRP
jgi:hypothetical protein